ncbi:MAG: TIM barrel protein [Chloroflexi bacterium]|nr:TIM barrel protein [Chloroflexota bacterium]
MVTMPVPDRERYPLRTIPGYDALRPGIQIGTQFSSSACDDDLILAQQLGVEWAMVSVDDPSLHSVEGYLKLKERFAAFGLQIYRIANHRCHNMSEVTLGLPERDARIAEYLQYIRNLGAAGIHYATYAHMANGIWSSGSERTRGGAESRAFRLESSPVGRWIDTTFAGELTHGRAYTEAELWDNYAYFIRKVVPVAEESGVYIGIHPDDPPAPALGGIPRPLFSSFEGYRRALEMASSPNIGVCLCVGCWLEGGAAMGKDVVEAIHFFGSRRQLFKVHLRNVSAPLPEGFVETYLDDGYMDMLDVVSALQAVRFDGAIISDHLPSMVGGRRVAEAYHIGYMRALVHATGAD